MKKIDHYVILGKKKYSDSWYFVDGYKSLATLRKRFDVMRDTLISVPHDHNSIMLCSRDENKNILKIYDEFD